MNAYSKDLRFKVLDALERGIPRREISELLEISISTVSRYVKLKASGADLAPRRGIGSKAKILDIPAHKRALWRQLQETTPQLLTAQRDVREGAGISVSVATMSRGKKCWVDFQKGSMASSERNEERRSAFREST
jgi:transposase